MQQMQEDNDSDDAEITGLTTLSPEEVMHLYLTHVSRVKMDTEEPAPSNRAEHTS